MVYDMLRELASQPRAQEETVFYLADHLSQFIRRMDPVLICLPSQQPGQLCHLMEQAVLMCEGVPVVWGADHRWMSILRLAFSSRARAIISTPLIALGLSKLQSYYSTPLFIRDVITAGYPCEEWIILGKGLIFVLYLLVRMSLNNNRIILFVGTKRSRSILYPISTNTQW